MTKVFNVIDGGIVPPRSLDSARIAHGFSDCFFAKIITIGGDEKYSMASWDFKRGMWKSPMSGLNSVIEYYVL